MCAVTERVLKRTSDELGAFLRPLLRLTEEEEGRLLELLEEFVEARAEERASNALDREFNRGDYRY